MDEPCPERDLSRPSQDLGFRFADPPPGAVPGGISRIPPAKLSRGRPKAWLAGPPVSQEERAPSQILDEDWSSHYNSFSFFAESWELVTNGGEV